MTVHVHNHIENLMNLSNADYTKYLDDLIEELSANQPLKWMIKGSIQTFRSVRHIRDRIMNCTGTAVTLTYDKVTLTR